MRWNDKRGMLNVGDFYKNDKFGENSEFVAKKVHFTGTKVCANA